MLERYAYLWWRGRRVQQFLKAARRGQAVQREVLLTKLRRNASSHFGRDHALGQVRSVADFRRHIPVADFEYYRAYVERVKQGDVQAMFGANTRLLMFALTSGTTSEPKYIPITEEFFREYRSSWQLWGLATYGQHLDLVRKQTLQLSSDWQQSFTEAGIPCGNISGLAAETAPRIARPLFILPRSVIKIHDAIAKHYTALRLALATDRLGMVVTANPSTLVELARLADGRRESLIRDIHDGTLSDQIEVPTAIRQSLARVISRPRPERARALEQICTRHGQLTLAEAWPRLSVLAVWTGGSVGVYLPQVQQHYGPARLRDHGLSASEGRMTIPLRDQTSAGILDYVHHFFEFIPEREHGRPSAVVLEAHELEVGQDYYIVLTTSSGLYRYDIQDVVRCVDYEGQVPVLEFLNKGTHFSSITGEKLSEFQVVEAVRRSFDELGLAPGAFTVAPVMDDRPNYVLLLEPDIHAHREHELAERVDQHLAELNWEYAEKIRTGRLKPLRVREVPAGTWSRFRHVRVARRGNFEEFKHPCLVNDMQFVERLLDAPHRAVAGPHVESHRTAEDY